MSENPKGACAQCGSADGEVCPCLGCETPYHAACVVGRGCAHPDCPMRGLAGRHVLPRDPVAGPVASVFGLFAAVAFAGVQLQRSGGNMRTQTPVELAMYAALACALVALLAGYVRDRMTPAGRVLHREIVGRVLVLAAGLLWIGAAFDRGTVFAVSGWLSFLAGLVAMAARPNRKTHHPLRRGSGLPEMAVNLFVAWFLFATIVGYFMFGGGSGRRERANSRACYSNQKTIVGALEMYNLDRKSRLEFTPALFEPLRSGGYLQSVPQDPGQGPGTSGNYRSAQGGNGLSCTVHGAIQ